IQYATGRIQYGQCRLWILLPILPLFCVTKAPESGALGLQNRRRGWTRLRRLQTASRVAKAR
ncbi:hypothetical protein, partial [uncultured Pseudomonas sp.]|uniref:hypothetical protein n=1 Tax=uncultured Pseudomonas sp. TaxID=114707 RepID=UPI00259561D5